MNVNKLFIIQELYSSIGAKRSQTIFFFSLLTSWFTIVIIVLPYNVKSSIIITHSAQEISYTVMSTIGNYNDSYTRNQTIKCACMLILNVKINVCRLCSKQSSQ